MHYVRPVSVSAFPGGPDVLTFDNSALPCALPPEHVPVPSVRFAGLPEDALPDRLSWCDCDTGDLCIEGLMMPVVTTDTMNEA